MKKRVLALLMTICMAAGLSACEEKGHKFAEITIEGEKYNLSKDFEEVVKGLVKNDVQVISYVNSSLLEPNGYNEECKLEKAEEYEDTYLYADYAPVTRFYFEPNGKDVDDLVIKVFELWDGVVEYETASGIAWDSDEDDLEELKGYVKMDTVFHKIQTTYGALYVDGKIVDLSRYEDEFEEWKDFVNENGFYEAMEEYLPNQQYYNLSSSIWAEQFKTSRSYKELKEACDNFKLPLKNVMLTNFAMRDAGEKLEDGEIESYALIRYEVSGDGEICMQYLEYSIDEDWDEDDYK